jgi:phage/plasmid primase-like uncharacterized protein
MGRHLDAREIQAKAKGRWIEILSSLAPSLGKAVDNFSGKYSSNSREFCPVHGGKSGEAFTLFKDADQTGGGVCNSCGTQSDGISLLMWIHNWSFRETLENVADCLDIECTINRPIRKTHTFKPPVLSAKQLADAAKLIAKRDKIIGETVPINHWSAKPAQRYFSRRGLNDLNIIKKEVKFHKGLKSWCKLKGSNKFKDEGVFPCIISIIRNDKGLIMNIHKTFITSDGYKAPINSPRKLGQAIETHPMSGGGIQINPASETMGIAEGLETILAVKTAYPELSVHCTLNAQLMKNWLPPVGVKKVFIFADLDKTNTGEVAAQTLYDKLTDKGIVCYICLPDDESHLSNVDWADVLEIHGINAFPELP